MRTRRSKKGMAGILMASALCLALLLPQATGLAVERVEADRPVSLTLTEPREGFEELKELEIPVSLYRVASVSGMAEYAALPGFEGLGVENISSKTTAQQWSDMAKLAEEVVMGGAILPDAQLTVLEGSGTVEDLATGLYLVYAETTYATEDGYRFLPYLVSLPNNQYLVDHTGEDEWIYDVAVALKPEQFPLYGDLELRKTLRSYNETLKGAIFVFEITAVKDGETVYSDVATLNFSAAGMESLVIEDLPAGSEVTVKEVYKGASYDVVGSDTVTTTIVAKEFDPLMVEADGTQPDGSDLPNTVVAFENDYDNSLKVGTGVVNHFERTEVGWDWEQMEDNQE